MDLLIRTPKIINEKFNEYFFPTVLIALANNLTVIIDSVMVGNILGSREMAAIQLFSPINQLYYALTILFGLGTSILISMALGERNKRKADSVLTVSFITIVVIIVLLMVIQFGLLKQIVSLLTPLDNMKVLTTEYYIPFIFGTPFYMFLCTFEYCIRIDGRPKFASALIIISNFVNMIFDFVLMKIFNFGISGSSIATVIGNALAFFIMLSQFWYKGNSLKFNFSILKHVEEFIQELSSIVMTGLSGSFATLLVTIRVFFLNDMVQRYGSNDGIEAMSVASMALILISSFIIGSCQTMVTLVSTFYAQKDNKAVGFTIKRTLVVLMILTLVTVILMEIFPTAFSDIFGQKSATALVETVTALRITALSYPGLGLTFLILYYLTATKRNTMSLFVSFLNGLMSVPVAYIFSYFLGLNGVWIGIFVAQYLVVACGLIMFEYTKIKSKGKYKNLLLLEPNDESEIVTFSVKSDHNPEELERLLRGKPELEINKRAHLITEALSHVKTLKESSPFYIDVRVLENKPDLEVFMRVNQPELNMNELNKIDRVEVNKVLGMNEIEFDILN